MYNIQFMYITFNSCIYHSIHVYNIQHNNVNVTGHDHVFEARQPETVSLLN